MKSALRKSAITVFWLMFLAIAAVALQQPATTTPPATSSSTAASSGNAGTADGQASADANSNEPKGTTEELNEEENATFKYSPAVRFIAKHTGLSLTSAFWACYTLNFAIIAILIWLAMKSNLPAMLRGRTHEIQKGMEEARRSSEEAKRRLQDIESRLSRLGTEIAEMQKHAEAEGKAEEERIRASIEEEKHKILHAAEQEVAQATNTARRELQKYAVDLAIHMAEKGIRLDANEDKALVEEFSEQLAVEARRNGGS
jgi:F-type H+-transporting ATPase subunit b